MEIAATPPTSGPVPVAELQAYLQRRSEARGIFRRIEAFDGTGATRFKLEAPEGAALPLQQVQARGYGSAYPLTSDNTPHDS